MSINRQSSIIYRPSFSVICRPSSVFYPRPSTPVENIRQISSFIQNKPNFPHFSLENDDFVEKQTQFKPNQSQLPQRPKMTIFTRKMSSTIVFYDFLANFITLKGAKNQGGKPKQTYFKADKKPNSIPIFTMFDWEQAMRKPSSFKIFELTKCIKKGIIKVSKMMFWGVKLPKISQYRMKILFNG
jgi:hypothetical protein